MQNIPTDPSQRSVNSSCHSIHPANQLTLQRRLGHQNRSINSHAPENRSVPLYSIFPSLPQSEAGHGLQHFDPYFLYSQTPSASSFAYPVVAMNGGIDPPYHTYVVTSSDILFGIQSSEYSYQRKLVYPYDISNPFERDIFRHDPRIIAQQQVPVGIPLSQPSIYAHPAQSPINQPVFYPSYGSSVSFLQSTQSIGVPPLNQPLHRYRAVPASIPKGPSHNFCSESLLSRGPPRKPKQSGFALRVGNLPENVHIRELKDFFGMDELESILLIRKSNCAFVNYKTEASCEKALSLFHNKGTTVYHDLTNETVFKNVRLVCRLRRPTGQSPPGSLSSESLAADNAVPRSSLKEVPSSNVNDLSPSHTLANPIHYFIMKSLTKNELAWSVANNVWTTQLHNERALNEAFKVTLFPIFISAAH
jgi:hypothetical protein